MSNQKRERKPRANRPTDSFGGPNNRRNSISFTVTLAAIAIFLLLQWTGGDLGPLLNNSATLSETGAPPATRQSTPVVDNNNNNSNNAGEEATPVAQAAVTERATQPPAPTNTVQAQSIQTPRATTQPTPTANAPPAARASDLPTIAYADLPPEAHDTIALIEQGGPFPFRRDGITFQNRERLLPRHPEGYYREYTVITPGEDDRGARRTVTGEAGELYYTDDHYDSFREIIR
jgi:ribonuclease T1